MPHFKIGESKEIVLLTVGILHSNAYGKKAIEHNREMRNKRWDASPKIVLNLD